MAYVTVKIVKCEPGVSKRNGTAFRRLTLDPGGLAGCVHEDMFGFLEAAAGGDPVVLDIVPSENLDRQGNPYLNVEGYEHPGQEKLYDPNVPGQAL